MRPSWLRVKINKWWPPNIDLAQAIHGFAHTRTRTNLQENSDITASNPLTDKICSARDHGVTPQDT